MMMIEIPDPPVILGMVVAFFVGLGGLYLFYKVRSYAETRNGTEPMSDERLEYYERQLIDMKIRLDAMEIQATEQKSPETGVNLEQVLEKFAGMVDAKRDPVQEKDKKPVPEVQKPMPVPSFEHSNVVDYVLHLITDKAMTSRDIQITLKRSREHTSRLMKKLFEDGYVQRSKTTPYTYSITDKGKEKISAIGPQNVSAAQLV